MRSRGRNLQIEIRSDLLTPLWFHILADVLIPNCFQIRVFDKKLNGEGINSGRFGFESD
jgi:hypothetical protein